MKYMCFSGVDGWSLWKVEGKKCKGGGVDWLEFWGT